MNFRILGRLAGVLAVTAGLAGCMDVNAEIEVLSATTGKATTSMTIGADFYPMIKQMAASGDTKSEPFCAKEGEKLTENADGSATCVTTKEGELATLTAGEDGGPSDDASFTEVSPGVVKVVFKTSDMKNQVTEGAGGAAAAPTSDAETAQALAMIKPYFEGHKISITIKGKKITDTNMTASGDGTSATTEIPFNDLLDGKATVPDELYAVVDTN